MLQRYPDKDLTDGVDQSSFDQSQRPTSIFGEMMDKPIQGLDTFVGEEEDEKND